MQLEESTTQLRTGQTSGKPIVWPGRNCSTCYSATRAAVLVDGEAYFERLAQSLSKARHSIFIIAWDFDAAIRLAPSQSDQTVGQL